MRKRRLLLGLGAILCGIMIGAAGCGDEDVAEVPKEVSVTTAFINQTGNEVGILQIRPTEEAEWSANLLSEDVWKNNYEVPVTLTGVLPETEAGWQVQMTFLDGQKEIWNGITLADGETLEFIYDEALQPAFVTVENVDAEMAEDTDVPVAEGAEGE